MKIEEKGRCEMQRNVEYLTTARTPRIAVGLRLSGGVELLPSASSR